MFTRTIPSSGESLPVIGLGTWQTFSVGSSGYPALRDVLTTLHASGGRLIDSSPMYGRAEEVVGNITSSMQEQNDFFYATKVWTRGAAAGQAQIAESYQRMKREVMDLMQIHNLVDWQTHLPYLRRLKDEGKLRYIGITHYQESSHEALAAVIRQEPIDFVQCNYSIGERHAAKFLLPLCAEKGIATIINRPFGEGHLLRRLVHQPLPAWAVDSGIKSWSAYLLKFILANPAVTCVIPATGNARHAEQNLQAGTGMLPDVSMLKRMVDYVKEMA
jgi:diketogulonate reductase-like aldo/keto reductase